MTSHQPKSKTPKRAGASKASKPKSNKAYELIKNRLISAKYVPGQFLQAAQICAELKLGRTPVNQALHRLQQEGLVEIIPRKGTLVKSDSLNEIFLALEVRALLEPYCATRCAEKATASELEDLQRLIDEYDDSRDEADLGTLMELDRRLHIRIAEVAGNELLADFLRSTHERMSRIWFLPHWQFHDFGQTGREHNALFEAIKKGDGEAAGKAMLEHVESLRRRIMNANAS